MQVRLITSAKETIFERLKQRTYWHQCLFNIRGPTRFLPEKVAEILYTYVIETRFVLKLFLLVRYFFKFLVLLGQT